METSANSHLDSYRTIQGTWVFKNDALAQYMFVLFSALESQ